MGRVFDAIRRSSATRRVAAVEAATITKFSSTAAEGRIVSIPSARAD